MSILAITGSLRKHSFTTAVLNAAVAGASGLDIEMYDIIGRLPHYDQDVDEAQSSAEVVAMREKVAACDGLLIATPEYNYSIPGPLKNWLDWASRPYGKHSLVGKKIAVFGVSPSPRGGQAPVEYLRSVLPALGAELVGDELLLGGITAHLDPETGTVSDEVAAKLVALLAGF